MSKKSQKSAPPALSLEHLQQTFERVWAGGDYAAALEIALQGGDRAAAQEGEQSLARADWMVRMAEVYMARLETGSALKYLQQALAIRRAALGPDDPAVVETEAMLERLTRQINRGSIEATGPAADFEFIPPPPPQTQQAEPPLDFGGPVSPPPPPASDGGTDSEGLPAPDPPRRSRPSRARPAGEPEAAFEKGQPVLTRYPNLDCPEQTLLDQPFSLFVQLLTEAPAPGAAGVQIEDSGDRASLPEVEVILRAPSFRLEDGTNTRALAVQRAGPSEVRFELVPLKEGPQEIRVDLYQRDRPVGTLRRTIQVSAKVKPARPARTRNKTAPAPPADPIELKAVFATPSPDLYLRILTSGENQRTLIFELNSPREEVDCNYRSFGPVTLNEGPLEKMQAVYKELTLKARQDVEPNAESAMEVRRLAALGNQLWDELIPAEMKTVYWKILPFVRTLLITSDEPWIPWEMVKPYRFREDDNQREDAPYWCQQFSLARWLSGAGAADSLPVGSVRPVAATDSNLAGVQPELDLLRQLEGFRPGLRSLPPLSQPQEVLDWLEQNDFGLLHFACHGNFNPALPTDSEIELTGGELRPSDLRVRFGGKRPRPLVFINACHGSRTGFSFTGMGGWAVRWVEARVGSFVGAMWEVNDVLALDFARAFYTALLKEGKAVAEAFGMARETIRLKAPHNSTWLAYVLYADPEARVGP